MLQSCNKLFALFRNRQSCKTFKWVYCTRYKDFMRSNGCILCNKNRQICYYSSKNNKDRTQNTAFHKSNDVNNFGGSCLSTRRFCKITSHFKDEMIFTDKEMDQESEDQEKEETETISEDDLKYQQMLRDFCEIPGAGHQVLVIQPEIKTGKSRPVLTTADLRLAEACALVETLPKWKVVKKMIVPVYEPKSIEVFRQNRINDITNEVNNNKHITAVFISSDHLYRYQIAYLQDFWNVPIIDRYQLVLHIFKEHAKTKEAKLQVALAEIPFIRKHLDAVTEGTHDQQTGSHHYVGGRHTHSSNRQRLLKRKELILKKELVKVRHQREMTRKHRQRKRIPTVAVVGYTNCGKTTLIKALTGDKDMVPEDKLFATLDVTAHGGIMSSNLKIIYMDTVGFISDIPIHLIDAFSATLEDALFADVIIHLTDVSHPDVFAQDFSVKKTLANLLPEHQLKKVITVGNKIDLVNRDYVDLDPNCIYISAVTGQGLSVLEDKVQQSLMHSSGLLEKKIRIPMNGPHINWLYKMAAVKNAVPDTDNEHLIVDIIINENIYHKFKALFGKPTSRRKPRKIDSL